jgi:cytoskeletal protein CcmA (bactofilin family)
MTMNGFRMGVPNIAYIGAGVTVKGAIVVPDVIVVDGIVEGDVTARSIRIGPTGGIRGKVISADVDVHGTLAESAEIRDFLLVRSTGRVEGNVNCGDMQVEKGAMLAAGIFSTYTKAVNDNAPAPHTDTETPAVERFRLDAAE